MNKYEHEVMGALPRRTPLKGSIDRLQSGDPLEEIFPQNVALKEAFHEPSFPAGFDPITEYGNGKSERNTLYTSLIDTIADRMEKQYRENPPYGLVTYSNMTRDFTPLAGSVIIPLEEFDSHHPFGQLQTAWGVTMVCEFNTYMEDVKSGGGTDVDQTVHEGLKFWGEAHDKLPRNLDGTLAYGNVESFGEPGNMYHTFAGVKTAGAYMVGVLEAIPRLTGYAGTPEEYVEIAKNSIGFFSPLTALDNYTVNFLDGMLLDWTNPDLWRLKHEYLELDTNGKPRVKLQDKVWQATQVARSIYPDYTREEDRTGCPVAHSVNGKIPLERLWNHLIPIAGDIYKAQAERSF